ncbi:MAG: hypothetical protein CMO01_25460 [Thalassobius sp.]|nr:hypothetical protein [Thalassovita sp.]|tara:strand:+ start:1051 stop:1317 length:267 start_codon:yes stop_codon:yes gene_type:complete
MRLHFISYALRKLDFIYSVEVLLQGGIISDLLQIIANWFFSMRIISYRIKSAANEENSAPNMAKRIYLLQTIANLFSNKLSILLLYNR